MTITLRLYIRTSETARSKNILERLILMNCSSSAHSMVESRTGDALCTIEIYVAAELRGPSLLATSFSLLLLATTGKSRSKANTKTCNQGLLPMSWLLSVGYL